MEFFLYPGDTVEHLNYFLNCFDILNLKTETDTCSLGYCIKIQFEEEKQQVIAENIGEFFLEFYLKEAILTKIYEEYSILNPEDACFVLTAIAKNISDFKFYQDITHYISNIKRLNTESYVLFHLKDMMREIYAMVDKEADNLIYERERLELISMIRTYAGLHTGLCSTADVEFGADMTCAISLDGGNKVNIDCEKLLVYLTENAPDLIRLKNTAYCPELAGIVNEVFGESVRTEL